MKEPIVRAAYLAVTLLTAVFTGMADLADLIGHGYPKSRADMLGVPQSWVLPLGVLLAVGAAGLLAGVAGPALGTLAAAGLVLHLTGALIAHLRVHDRHFGPWGIYFSLAVAALA